jgi:GTP cyclohydrolase I
MQFLTHGYALDPLEILKELSLKIIAKFVVKNIELYMCEHHMLPFLEKHT